MLSYPVRLISTDQRRVRAVVLDVPEAVAEGETEDEAMENIKYSLELALGHRLHGKRSIPAPSDVCGAPVVTTNKFILQPPDDTPISGGRY
jgi:predicted RNase H-like HicB family nuclease